MLTVKVQSVQSGWVTLTDDEIRLLAELTAGCNPHFVRVRSPVTDSHTLFRVLSAHARPCQPLPTQAEASFSRPVHGVGEEVRFDWTLHSGTRGGEETEAIMYLWARWAGRDDTSYNLRGTAKFLFGSRA